jgi:hypothetical protein
MTDHDQYCLVSVYYISSFYLPSKKIKKIAEILLKVALNTITLTPRKKKYSGYDKPVYIPRAYELRISWVFFIVEQ